VNGREDSSPIALRMPMDIRSISLTVLAVLAVILILKYAQAVIIPFVLGILVSYALDPLVTKLARWHVVRPLAAAAVLLGVVAGGGALLYTLRYQVDAIVQQLPAAASRLRRTLEKDGAQRASTIQQVQKAATELEKAADAAAPPTARPGVTRVQVEAAPVRVSEYLMSSSLGIATVLAQLLLVLLLAYFLLASGDLYRRKLVKIAGPSLTKKKITVQILEEIDRQIERFLLVQLFASTVVGVTTWLVLLWIGLEQAATWGLLAGVFNSIPYFGPVLITGATSIAAFLQFGSIQMAVLTGASTLAITTVEGLLLTPWLSSRAARMNAVAVFVGLLFWGWVWNVWGMLLAVPMLMVIKAVCDHVEDCKGIGELLGE
jgi:predicted PurR-regulated permease PerM